MMSETASQYWRRLRAEDTVGQVAITFVMGAMWSAFVGWKVQHDGLTSFGTGFWLMMVPFVVVSLAAIVDDLRGEADAQ